MTARDFRLLIKFLGVTLVICAIGGLTLAGLGKSIPDAVIGLGAGSLAALGAAFVQPPRNEEPQLVHVDNAGPGEAVPVDAG